MPTPRLKIKRGSHANLPASGMLSGEPHFTTDRGTFHVATDATTQLTVVPAIEELSTIGAVNTVNDLLIIHDQDEAGSRKEKKITVANLKTALNIPESSSDEKVAVADGATAVFLEDALVDTASIKFERPEIETVLQDYLIAYVDVVDCGTF